MQQLTCKMVWSFSFYSLFKKDLNFKRNPGGEILKKCEKKLWKSVKSAKKILPFSCCPLVFLP